MPRPRKSARLWLRPARQDRGEVYVILDGGREISTGCGKDDRAGAEKKLAAYIAEHHPELSAALPLIGVYLLMRKGKIVYIGSSLDMPSRVAQHRTNGRPFDQVFYLVTMADQRTRLEAILIKTINPAQNKRLPTRQVAVLAEVEAILTSHTINGTPTILSLEDAHVAQ